MSQEENEGRVSIPLQRELGRDVLLLKLASLIADKGWINACANRELDLGGWLSDWQHEMNIVNSDISSILVLINET